MAAVDGLVTPDAPDAPDAYAVELGAVCAHFGAELTDLEHLLSPVLARQGARQQVQPLLELGWVRLHALRDRIGELRERFSEHETARLVEQASDALKSGAALSLTTVEESLERAFQLRGATGVSHPDMACFRGAQALAAGLSLNFPRAAALSDEAADLAQDDFAACWRYRVQQAEFLRDQGREFGDVDALLAVERLFLERLAPLAPAHQRPDERAWIYDCLGNTLGLLGRRQRGTRTLERAIDAFAEALTLWGRARRPQDWAATQNNLGNAIGILGQRQQDPELLEQSVAAFESALEVQTRDDTPEAWASTHSNLAAVLQTLGQQKKDAKRLKRAVDAYKSALVVWTRERKPLVWAATMGNLGSALRLLGNQRKGPRTLEQSVAAYNAALSVQTRDRMPHDWARLQNDLGAALQALGERNDDPLLLGRAVAAYREAVQEITREREPMTWAMSIANLGVARRKLAERNHDCDIARRAADDIKMAVDVFRGASHAQLTELGEEQLSIARKLTASLEAPAAH